MSGSNAPLAVILLNWNGLADTIECVESLLNANYTDLRIYVVDNASANNEADLLIERFPKINVLKQSENLGFCKGNNVGIEKAIQDGMEYILILNNDTLVPDSAISVLVDEYQKLDQVGALSPVIMEYPEKDIVWYADAQWDISRAQFSLNPGNKTLEELKVKNSWPTEFACGCCLLTTASVINKAGLLDERYFAYYDEADWCKRIERVGYRSFATSSTVIFHKVSRTTPKMVSTYLMTRNRLLWMKENLSFSQRLSSFFYLKKEFLWHLLNNRGLRKGQYSKAYSKAFLRGYYDFHRGLFFKWNKETEKVIF